jgi:hypothetical protein
MNRLVALLAAALAVLSAVRYQSDRLERRKTAQFLLDFDVPARQPATAATLPLVPSASLGAQVIADVALTDAFGTVNLAEVSPELRNRWLRALERVDDELVAARGIALDALAARPGWPDHWTIVGELAYASHRRAPQPDDLLFWEGPLRKALVYFPGDDSVWTFASTAYLENWPELPATVRARAVPTFRRALLDPGFASMAFPALIEAVGADQAIGLLPEEPATLLSAFDAMAKGSDMARVSTLYYRWEAAEHAARRTDLAELEQRARLGDVEQQREIASNWLSRHPATDFDTPAGRAQTLRVLQLAVNDRIGSWQSDPRAAAVRFLLNRRINPSMPGARGIETAPGGGVIATVVSSLAGVPEPIRARARLFGGDVEGAQAIFERSDSAGSFEWTPYLLDLAAYRMSQSSFDSARAAIEALAPAARAECDPLLLRRKLDALSGSPDTLRVPAMVALPATAWSSSGALSFCVDPDAGALQQLSTVVESPVPTLAAWGWNDGRHGVIQLDAGRVSFHVSYSGRAGRQTFFVRSLTGAHLTLGATTISTPSRSSSPPGPFPVPRS